MALRMLLRTTCRPKGQENTMNTCVVIEARAVQQPREELEADDGVNDNDEEHEQRDVQQRDHGHQDGVQHNLET